MKHHLVTNWLLRVKCFLTIAKVRSSTNVKERERKRKKGLYDCSHRISCCGFALSFFSSSAFCSFFLLFFSFAVCNWPSTIWSNVSTKRERERIRNGNFRIDVEETCVNLTFDKDEWIWSIKRKDVEKEYFFLLLLSCLYNCYFQCLKTFYLVKVLFNRRLFSLSLSVSSFCVDWRKKIKNRSYLRWTRRRKKSVDVFCSRLNHLEHLVNVMAMKIIETRFSSKRENFVIFS